MFTKRSIGLEDARHAVAAAAAAVGPHDGPSAVVVTDERGDVVYLARQNGASAVDVRNAERKAYTAAFLGRDTSMYHLQIAHDGRSVADWSDRMVTTLHGGWTLRRGGQVIGGIGVSGTGDEDRDERLALAGAQAAAQLSVDAWRAQRRGDPAPGQR